MRFVSKRLVPAAGDAPCPTTYTGRPCKHCGGTVRYASNYRCRNCVLATSKARQAARMALKGNALHGLENGFLRFGTLAHRILVYIHEYGPACHADLSEELADEGVSVNLGRLCRHGFLFRAGRTRKPGERSSHLYSLSKTPAQGSLRRISTRAEIDARCRAKRKLRVSSVFDFRGRISISSEAHA